MPEPAGPPPAFEPATPAQEWLETAGRTLRREPERPVWDDYSEGRNILNDAAKVPSTPAPQRAKTGWTGRNRESPRHRPPRRKAQKATGEGQSPEVLITIRRQPRSEQKADQTQETKSDA